MKEKRTRIYRRRIIPLVLLLILAAALLTACGTKKKIDASSMIGVAFQGLNGEGSVILTFDAAALTETLSKEKALTERQMETLAALDGDLQKDFSVSKRDGLSNGDTVEITGGLDKDLLKDLGYVINNDTIKVTVEGLIDPLELNAADYVSLNARGFEGYGEVYAYFDTEAFSKAIADRWAGLYPDEQPDGFEFLNTYQNCAYGVQIELDRTDGYSNNDAVNGTITLTASEIPECGVILTGGTYTGTVEGLEPQEEADLASAVTISFEGTVPYVTVRQEVDYSLPFVHYTSLNSLSHAQTEKLRNGDTYTLDITYDEEELGSNGFTASNPTVSATVEGLPSFEFKLSGVDDPLLAGLDARVRPEVDAAIRKDAGSLSGKLLGDREGWVQWNDLSTALETEALAVADDGTWMDNMLFLVYHTAAPLRLVDGSVETGDVYHVFTGRTVTLSPDNELSVESDSYIYSYAAMDEVDEFIASESGYRLGENVSLTRADADTSEELAVTAAEPVYEMAEANLEALAVDSCALAGMIPDYANRVETWETMTDPYGNEYENVMALRAGDRARVDYRLDGSWNRFTGTLCTYNDAGTEAMMSLYVWGDDRILYAVDAYQRARKPETFAIDVTGVQILSIQTVSYGSTSGAWLFISDGLFEATGEAAGEDTAEAAGEDTTEGGGKAAQVFASLSDLLFTELRNMDIRPWSSMCTDINGRVMRDCYEFDSWDGSIFRIKLGGRYTSFHADIMLTEIPWPATASAKLEVLADGEQAAMIRDITMFGPAQSIDLDVSGVDLLELRASRQDEEEGGEVIFAIGNSALYKEADGETETDSADTALTEYAPLNTDLMAVVEGEYAAGEVQSIDGGDYRYVIVNRPCSYATAEFTATRLGGTLAAPKTNRQCAVLTELLQEGSGDRYWIGAKRESPDSETWVWTDGEIMTDMGHWDYGEPSNSDGKENCLMVYRDGDWNDYPEDTELPFVMQLPAVSGGLPEGAASLADLTRTAEDEFRLVAAEYDGVNDPLTMRFDADYNGWAEFELDGRYTALDAVLHVQPESSCNARAMFAVFGDGRLLYQADDLKCTRPVRRVHADVTGVRTLKVMTSEYVSGGSISLDLTQAWLTGTPEQAEAGAVDVMTLEPVDSREMGTRYDMAFDSAGDLHPGWIALDAADEGFVMYNPGASFSSVRGVVCGGESTSYDGEANVNIYVDDQLAATVEGIRRDGRAQPFEVDISGADTLRFAADYSGESWEDVVYLAGVTLD